MSDLRIDFGGGAIIDAKAQLLELERADYEDSLYLFMRDAWRTFDAAHFKDSWAIEAVAEHLQAVVDGDIRRLLINIPPRMSKSSICSVCFPAWVWSQPFKSPTSGPGVQFLCGSYASSLALRDSVKCRKIIDSPWYKKYWGDRFQLSSDQNTKSRFSNDAGGERLTTSVDGVATGEGGNIIIIDDPNDSSEKASEAAIQATIDWWDTTMSTRLNDPKTGAYIVIQQRLAENDLSGHILETEDDWTHLMLPMRYEADRSFVSGIGWKDPRSREGALLAPDRFGEDEVKRLEKKLGPWQAAGQLQQRPEPKGGGIIKREWWQLWDDPNFPLFDFIIASLDPAYTEKEENDPSALTIWGVFSDAPIAQPVRVMGPDGKFAFDERSYQEGAPKVMLMFAWDERLELNDLVQRVRKDCKRFRVNQLVIENKASGISVSQEIRRLYKNDPYSVILNDPKNLDKYSRLYSVQHLFAEGMIWAPDKQWAERVITQVGQFPKGRHDDLVDTVSQSIRRLRDMGVLERPEEREADAESRRRYPHDDPKPLYPGC